MIKLTDPMIKAMPADPHRLKYIWDAHVRGFGVRCTPLGVKSFIYRYRNRRDSRQHIMTLGRVDEIALKDARDKARQLLAEVAQGKNPAVARNDLKTAPTVADLAKKYEKDHAPRKRKSSQANDKLLWKKYILPSLGHQLVASVRTADVMALHNSMIRTPAMANRALALLSKAFSLAELWEWRGQNTNPCKAVKKYPENRRQRILTKDELHKFGAGLAEAETNRAPGSQYADLLRLLVITGCRRDEWRLGRWEWVNAKDGTYNIPMSKTGAKTVYLAAPAVAILARILQKRGLTEIPKKGYIFGDRKYGRKGTNPISWSHKGWKSLMKRIGITDIRVHDLRHTVGSYAHAAGLSQKQVGDLLGHKRMETAARYIHNDAEKEAAHITGAAMQGFIDVKPVD